MKVGSIARDMKSRMPWDVAKRILAEHEIPKGHGWEKTLERLVAHERELASHADALTEAVEQHYIAGEKFSRFFNLTKKEIGEVRAAILDKRQPKNDFSEVYPALLSDSQIEKNFPHNHALAHVHKSEDGIAVIFASTRAIFVREPLEIDDLPKGLSDKYDEVVGIKLRKFQAMDAVWIPHEGTMIDVRVDYPRGMHQDQAMAAMEHTRKAFHRLCGLDVLTSPVNLFPLIDLIYRTANEGSVVEMAFGTTTASIKREKMRRSSLDLRKEIYHQGGKKALTTPIEPYHLSVEYAVKIASGYSLPEVSLNSTSRMLGSPNPTLSEVVIRKCLGLADYEFVRSRIEHFVHQHNSRSR